MAKKEKENKVFKKWIYYKTKEAIIIDSNDLDGYLTDGWKESPADFEKSPDSQISLDSDSETPSEIAIRLLNGEGLNHTSLTRGMGLDPSKSQDRAQTKEVFDEIIEGFGEKIFKQGHDYFFEEK